MRHLRSTPTVALTLLLVSACSSPEELEAADWTLAGAAFFSEVPAATPAPTAVGGVQCFRLRDGDGRSVSSPFSVRSTSDVHVHRDDLTGGDLCLEAVAAGVDEIVVETDTHAASFELEARAAANVFVVPNMAAAGLPAPNESYAVYGGSAWVRAHLLDDDGQALVDESLELVVNGSVQEGPIVTEYWDVFTKSFQIGNNTVSAVGYEDLSTSILGVDSVDAVEAVESVDRLGVGESAYLRFQARNAGRLVLGVPWDVAVSEELRLLPIDTGLCPCHSDNALVEGAAAGAGTVTVSVGDFSQDIGITVEGP